MSSASNIPNLTRPSDESLKEFCTGITYVGPGFRDLIPVKLLGATMDVDLMTELQQLDEARSRHGGPDPPRRQLVSCTAMERDQIKSWLSHAPEQATLSPFQDFTERARDSALQAFRFLYPQCQFEVKGTFLFAVIQHRPEGRRRMYRIVALDTDAVDFTWAKGCAMAYSFRHVLTVGLDIPEDEAPQCLVFQVRPA